MVACLAGSLSRFGVLFSGLPLGCLLLIRAGGLSLSRFRGFRQDALLLNESLDAGDVSQAWLVRSGAAETALADAYRFSAGPAHITGLILGVGMLVSECQAWCA